MIISVVLIAADTSIWVHGTGIDNITSIYRQTGGSQLNQCCFWLFIKYIPKLKAYPILLSVPNIYILTRSRCWCWQFLNCFVSSFLLHWSYPCCFWKKVRLRSVVARIERKWMKDGFCMKDVTCLKIWVSTVLMFLLYMSSNLVLSSLHFMYLSILATFFCFWARSH